MNPQIKKQFGIILQAVAIIGTELLGEGSEPTPAPAKKQGRSPKATPAPAEPEPTGYAPVAEPPTEPAPSPAIGKTYEELREVIRPLVEQGKGAEVKAVIAKYGTSLKDLPPATHAAFEKDIEALKY